MLIRILNINICNINKIKIICNKFGKNNIDFKYRNEYLE